MVLSWTGFFPGMSTKVTRREAGNNAEHLVNRLFTHAGSRIVRKTPPSILNILLRLTGSSKRFFRTRTQPLPPAIIIRFQNECWMGKDGSNPSYHLDGRKTPLLCFSFEKLCHEHSVPQLSSQPCCVSAISSSSWFPCGLPQPLA